MRAQIKKITANPYIRLGFGVILSGFLLYLALRDVDMNQVAASLKGANTRFVGLALFSVAVNLFSRTIRWRVLVGNSGEHIGFSKFLAAITTGQALNWYVPGRVGDLTRAYIIGQEGPGKTYTLGTVALEKALEMVAYALLFLLALLLLPLPRWISDSGFTLTIVAAGVMIGVVVLARYPEWFVRLLGRLTGWLPEPLRSRTNGRVQAGLSSLGVLHRRTGLVKLVFFTGIVWGTSVWNNYLIARALDMDISWAASLLVLIVLQAGITIPSVPGRIGIFQYLCILTLALFGVNQADGLAYGVLLQAVVLIPITLVSLIFFAMLGYIVRPIDVTSVPKHD